MGTLPSFEDRTDVENADKGFVGTASQATITDATGRVVWDLDAYAFLGAPCPDTANPSLWRQSRLTAKHGLYQVTDGIYQVRGFDLSNISFVEGDQGVIVVDPLLSTECAAAALSLYRVHRGDRPVQQRLRSRPRGTPHDQGGQRRSRTFVPRCPQAIQFKRRVRGLAPASDGGPRPFTRSPAFRPIKPAPPT